MPGSDLESRWFFVHQIRILCQKPPTMREINVTPAESFCWLFLYPLNDGLQACRFSHRPRWYLLCGQRQARYLPRWYTYCLKCSRELSYLMSSRQLLMSTFDPSSAASSSLLLKICRRTCSFTPAVKRVGVFQPLF